MTQTVMFTKEQMSGSGQSNMLDLIDRNRWRREELKTLPHTFWADPGHAWLEVLYSDLIVLDVVGSITRCSYRSGAKVYLEEDMDAMTYICALFGVSTVRDNPEFHVWRDTYLNSRHVEDNIFIRNLTHF